MISRSAPMPLNGQQLMMQLDGLTSAMTGMSVQEVIVDYDDGDENDNRLRDDPWYQIVWFLAVQTTV